MGKKTHGPYLLAAIEYNDINKVSDILSTKFRDKQNVKHFLVSEVRRLASEYTAVPLLLAAGLDDPTILKYFAQKHEVNVNHVHEPPHASRVSATRGPAPACGARRSCGSSKPLPAHAHWASSNVIDSRNFFMARPITHHWRYQRTLVTTRYI